MEAVQRIERTAAGKFKFIINKVTDVRQKFIGYYK